MYKKMYKETKRTKERMVLIIEDIIIEEEYREMGIGKKVLKELEKRYKTENVEEIEIPVFGFNERAINFYAKNDYNEYVKRFRKKI